MGDSPERARCCRQSASSLIWRGSYSCMDFRHTSPCRASPSLRAAKAPPPGSGADISCARAGWRIRSCASPITAGSVVSIPYKTCRTDVVLSGYCSPAPDATPVLGDRDELKPVTVAGGAYARSYRLRAGDPLQASAGRSLCDPSLSSRTRDWPNIGRRSHIQLGQRRAPNREQQLAEQRLARSPDRSPARSRNRRCRNAASWSAIR